MLSDTCSYREACHGICCSALARRAAKKGHSLSVCASSVFQVSLPCSLRRTASCASARKRCSQTIREWTSLLAMFSAHPLQLWDMPNMFSAAHFKRQRLECCLTLAWAADWDRGKLRLSWKLVLLKIRAKGEDRQRCHEHFLLCLGRVNCLCCGQIQRATADDFLEYYALQISRDGKLRLSRKAVLLEDQANQVQPSVSPPASDSSDAPAMTSASSSGSNGWTTLPSRVQSAVGQTYR